MNKFATLILAAAIAPAAFATTRSVPSQYSTVQDAINAASSGDTISIASGTYSGEISIPSSKTSLTIEGSSKTATILTSGANDTTVTVSGSGTLFENIELQNSSTANTNTNHVLIDYATKCEIKDCNVYGWEDTLYCGTGASMYVVSSTVQGSVDFVYGSGEMFLSGCTIEQMRSSPTGGTVAAPNTPSSLTYGIVFSSCTINSASGVPSGENYLGRPWGADGECAFINCTIGSVIAAVGWINWPNSNNDETCRVAEYPCPSGRVSWVKRLTSTEAAAYSKTNVLGGWNPS